MPSHQHEVLVELLRKSPEAVLDLLRSVSDAVPSNASPHIHSESFSQVKSSSHAADLALRITDGSQNLLGLIVEVQLETDDDKPFSWPLYAVGLRAELRRQTAVLVLTPSRHVARWASRPLTLGPGSVFQPLVIGPDEIPALLDLAQAKRVPALAFLSALAHAHDSAEIAARAAFNAIHALRQLDHRLFTACQDILQTALNDAALALLEKLMHIDLDKLQNESIRRNVRTGMIEGKADAILTVLETRGLELSKEQRERIVKCTDLDQLNRWLRHVALVTSADELFV